MTGFLAVANAGAGTAERAYVDAAIAVLAEAGPVRLRPTSSADDLDRALDDDGDVVVLGGDGSLHLAVTRLRARGEGERPVGLVPLGTGNDFARGVGLPLDPVAASRRVASGQARPVDLLVEDGGAVVVNAVHLGVGAAAADRAAALKARLGPLAYPVGALLAGAGADCWSLTVTVDGQALALPGDQVLLVGVGNGPFIGGGTPLCPGARTDDGRLDVVVACIDGRAARAAFGAALRDGTHLQRDDVVTATGTEVVVEGDAVEADADGELEDARSRRRWRVEPGGWRLRS